MTEDQDSQEEELVALRAIFSEEGYLKLNSEEQQPLLFRSTSQTTDNVSPLESEPTLTAATNHETDEETLFGDFSAQVRLPAEFQIRGK